MRKLKSKRIGNYLLKGLLLCALVVGGWFTADIGAKAESVTHSVEFKSEESQIVQFDRTDGLEQHIEVTNNTQRPMKVTFSHNIPVRNYNTKLWIGGHEVASRMATAVKDANVLYLYPCQWVEKACEVEFTRNAAAYTDITISAEFIDQKIGSKEDEIGLTKDTAYEIPLSGHPYSLYEGLTGTGTDERWYKFNVADKAVIDPSFHLVNTERATYFGQNRTFIRVYDSNNNQIYSEGSSQYNGKEAWEPGAKVLTRGIYYVCISTSKGAYYPAIFDFNLNGHNYISAEKIKCSHQEVNKSQLGNIKVVAETVPANSDDKIVEVYDHISGKTWNYNSNKVAHGEVPIYNIKAGRQSWLTFKTKNGKTYTTNLYVPVEKLKKPTVVTYHNYAKVTVGSTKMMGTNARIQIYKGGKWTTVKTVKDYNCYKATTVKNLKPFTTYKFRTQAYANGAIGTPSDVVTLKTGSAVKPAVKSIKIVQKKKMKVRGWTSPGHWSGDYWYPPIYHKPYTWTKYKVKVTLKKKVPKIGGMRIGDTWTKGNKKSYTVWLPKGAQTGKKLNIYMNTGLSKSNGQGPQIKKVIRAK